MDPQEYAALTAPGQRSQLQIPIPEAEPLVGHWRQQYDPRAAIGVPAHYTVLVPFVGASLLDEAIVADLRSLFDDVAPIHFNLARTSRFGNRTLYLDPEPAQPFADLIREVWRRYPDWPPYGNPNEEITPHLTVAATEEPGVLDRIESEISGGLPKPAVAREVWLMVQRTDRMWETREVFPLGGQLS